MDARSIVTTSLLALASYAPVVAEAVPPIEAYGRDPKISEMKLSPSGDRIVYTTVDGDDRIVVVATTGGEVVRALNAGEQQIDRYAFIDEDTLITYRSLTTSFPGYPGKHEVNGAIATDLTTGDSIQLLSRSRSVHFPQLELDRVLGPAAEKGHVLMAAFAGTPTESGKYALFRANVATGHAELIAAGAPETIGWFVDEREVIRAREDFDNRGDVHRIKVPAGAGWKTVYEKRTEIPTIRPVGLSPDKGSLVFVGLDPADEYHAVYHMSLEDGAISEPVFHRPGHDIAGLVSDWSGRILGVRYTGITPSYDFYDESLGKDIDRLVGEWPENAVSVVSTSGDRSKVLFHVEGRSTSGLYARLDRKTEKIVTMAHTRPDIPPSQVAPVLSLSVTARDGLRIPCLFTVPPGVTVPQKLPTVVMPHGGPESYDRLGFDYQAQFFASRGYLVIQPNFRGSSGFGSTHLRAGRGRWGREMQDDVTDALLHAIRAGAGDPERVCIYGASYGGYAALAGGAFTPELYRCVVAIAPVSDLHRMMKDNARSYGGDHWVVAYWREVVGDRGEGLERLKQISPARNAKRFRAPVLLIHGDSDTVVPFLQSRRMKNALEKVGKEVDLLRLEGETHDLSHQATRVQALRVAAEFIDRHLRRRESAATD